MNSLINIMFIVFIQLIIFNTGVSSQTQSLSCAKSSLLKLDNIFAKLVVVGNSGRTFPEKIDDLPSFCNASVEMIKTIDNHNQKCNKKILKQVMSLSVYTARQQMTQTCKKSKKRDQLMAAFPCANKSSKDVDKCMTKLIDAMIGAQNVEDKLKIPTFCCEYYKFRSCSSTAYDNTNGCSEKDKEVLINLMDSVSANVLNLLCGEYEEDSDKCKALPTPKKLKSQKRTKSFFIPLTQLLESFKDE